MLATVEILCYQRRMNDKSKNRGGGKGRPPSAGGAGRSRGPGARGDSSTPRGFHKARTPAPRGPSGDEEGKKAFRPRRPAEARPSGESTGTKRPFSPRPPREGASEGKRPFTPRGERPTGDRPNRERPAGDRPYSARPPREGASERPSGDRPFRGRPDGDRPRDGGQRDSRPKDSRPTGDRPYSDRGGKPSGFKGKPRVASVPKENPGERLCSRRDAEEWILAGRVSINDEVLTSPARDVLPTDTVEVDGAPLPTRERTRLFLYHKERGLVTTARDPEGRPTVFSRLPKNLPRVITIGRLDINTEGLMLLTNDGGLARIIELPETGWLRRYRVRCYGEISQPVLDSLRSGITVDGMNYGPIEATLDREKGDNVWLTLGLREGKNREVKRVLEHLGLQVNRLIRVSFGPFQLGDLSDGAVEEVKTSFLKAQLGPALTAESGVDFEAPIFNHEPEPEPEPVRERYQRPERTDRSDRPERPEREERAERPVRGRPDETDNRRGKPDRMTRTGPRPSRPGSSRPREDAAEANGDAPVRPKWRHPTEPLRSIWRAEDAEQVSSTRTTPKAPRRGADPKEIRTENAEREHRRSGSIKTRGGKSVLVEKLAPSRKDAPVREHADVEASRPSAPFKPRKPRPEGGRGDGSQRPERASRRFDDKPSGDAPKREWSPGGRSVATRSAAKPSGERPTTGRADSKPYRGGRLSGGKPSGDKPSGGRPSGGAARGPRPPRSR